MDYQKLRINRWKDEQENKERGRGYNSMIVVHMEIRKDIKNSSTCFHLQPCADLKTEW